MGLEGAKSGAFILRFIEMITSIVVFSTIVDYDWTSKIEFTMFVGITGFILAFFFMVLYVAGVRAARGTVSLVLDLIWTVFWLAAAGCMSNILVQGFKNSKTEASCAFAWISFFLWIGSSIISFQDMRGRNVAGPSPTAAPQIPSSSISMV